MFNTKVLLGAPTCSIGGSLREEVGFPGGASGKEPACQCRRCRFYLWIGKIPWRRAWQPIPVFWPGEPHGQRSLADYSPWGLKDSDTTERPSTAQHSSSSLQLCSTYLISLDSHNCPVNRSQYSSYCLLYLERLGPIETKRNDQGYTAGSRPNARPFKSLASFPSIG